MKEFYYTLPLQFDVLKTKNKEHTVCTFDRSIAQNIYLLITTRFGEHRYDDHFGCEIWDTDFEVITNINVWKERVRKSIDQALRKFEKRLRNVSVSIELAEEEIVSPISGIRSVKKRLSIRVTGMTIRTGQDFNFETKLFISPLSAE
ncbi:MAG TPA: GPW/gp25 family protein [Flavobacteriales bacterium]|jgi:phage baseplate assembly protein W|nr:GPW/gp25 family protein [Flavobacteriales bacterium]